jgi:hypothetical protein
MRIASGELHDPANLGLHALDINSGIPVFFALGFSQAVRGKPMESTSDLKEVSNEKQVGS